MEVTGIARRSGTAGPYRKESLMNTRYLYEILEYACVMLLCLTASGCGDFRETTNRPLVEVHFETVRGESITLTRELPGRVSAFTVSEVRPQVTGIIKERLFEEGADVTEGQVLYHIDPKSYQAAYNNARANLVRVKASEEAARLLMMRYQKLVKTNAVSVQELDDARAAYNQIRAEIDAYREALEIARINLEYTRVTAPVNGRIGRSFVTPGALVTENQQSPLATVQQISPVYVDVTQSNTQILRLKRELAAGTLVAGGPGATRVRLFLEDGSPYTRIMGEEETRIEGTLLFSDITVDQSTGTVCIRASFDNPDGMLLPGMYVRAVLEEGLLENALLVRQRSVMRDSRNQPFVYVLTRRPGAEEAAGTEAAFSGAGGFTVEARTVTLARRHGNRWLVSSGLSSGELVMVDGLQHARHGQVVAGTEIKSGNNRPGDAERPFTAQRGR